MTDTKHDRFGRYLLPHPDTGMEVPWTRATTVASTLEDRYNLEQWAKRNVALGIGRRPDLYARASAATPEDRDALTEVVKVAEEAAAASSGRLMGSAVHAFTERVDRGEDVAIPEPMASDVAAYRAAVADVKLPPEWIERVVGHQEMQIAGRVDRMMERDGALAVLDVKTGSTLDFAMPAIVIQLGIYVNATHYWDGAAWQPMPGNIVQDVGYVAHVPAGSGECQVYEVDLTAGWSMVQTALEVRAWRKRRGLHHPVSFAGVGAPMKDEPDQGSERSPASGEVERQEVEAPAAPSPEEPPNTHEGRKAWLKGRVEDIKLSEKVDEDDKSPAWHLAKLWTSTDIPTFPNGGPRDMEELDKIAAFCSLVEMTFTLPFSEPDPAREAKKP